MSRGGEDLTLRHGDYAAAITSIGGGLRMLQHAGRDLVVPYAADEVRPSYRGALVAPWPNRVADGRYTFDGADHELPLNEPERHNALHGLVCWERFEVTELLSDAVTLAHRIVPRRGYPFELELSVHYSLDDHGLRCTVRAHNVGDRRAPFGVAPHPYLRGGAGRVDDWTLQLPAEQVLHVTADRLLPTVTAPVGNGGFDFRAAARIGTAEADHAFTSLLPDADGLVRVRLTDAAERGVVCEWDPRLLPWVQVHTADLPDPERSRIGLAVEPMSCPPDAFNSGDDLVVLEPGGSHASWWTIRAV